MGSMQLNSSQKEVVTTRHERVLVLAGAGTGKTATCVHWVAGLVREGHPRHSILMITFTRKAAAEMAKRTQTLLKDTPLQSANDKITVGTYHATARILLRAEAQGFGLRNANFSTLDESEAQSIWKSALKQSGYSTKSPLHVPARLHSLYSLARNTCQPVEEIITNSLNHKVTSNEALHIVQQYEELKHAANVVDYDDLLVLWASRMEKDPAYAQHLRQRWPYVLVDEMQDNNQLNQRILSALDPQHLLVVGDANQSIYGFRGSDVKLIIDFPRRYEQAKVFRLEDNYRSHQAILDTANEVIAKTDAALHLKSARKDHLTEGGIEFRMYLTPEDEAKGTIEWIRNRVTAGCSPHHIAILARGSKGMATLEVQLKLYRIPYKKYGGLTLSDAAEVKDFISFLRVAHNPHDKIALLRALTQFPGIGEGLAAKAIASSHDSLFSEQIWPHAAADMTTWTSTIQETASLQEKGQFLEEAIRPLILHNYPKNGEERLRTINVLVNSMEKFEGSLADFLDSFSLDRTPDTFHPNQAITLSTIHSAKGLEWNSVWLVGASSTTIPHPRAQSKDEINEERRLFYVAITRAKEHLIVSYPSLSERRQNQKASPFIPPESSWSFCRAPHL